MLSILDVSKDLDVFSEQIAGLARRSEGAITTTIQRMELSEAPVVILCIADMHIAIEIGLVTDYVQVSCRLWDTKNVVDLNCVNEYIAKAVAELCKNSNIKLHLDWDTADIPTLIKAFEEEGMGDESLSIKAQEVFSFYRDMDAKSKEVFPPK